MSSSERTPGARETEGARELGRHPWLAGTMARLARDLPPDFFGKITFTVGGGDFKTILGGG